MATIILPARYQSQRYPGKPLAPIRGANGRPKPLIQRSYEAARKVRGVDDVVVATDDERIADHCRTLGATFVMTSVACANGTDRCAEAATQIKDQDDVLINFQGDALLTPPHVVEALISTIKTNLDVAVATPVVKCDEKMLCAFQDARRHGRIGETSAVFDRYGNALYFSKEILPTRRNVADQVPVFQHMGVYAYRTCSLLAYKTWPMGPLEQQESLEQLRFMEHGQTVRCCEVVLNDRPVHELNNPEDLPRIETALRDLGID